MKNKLAKKFITFSYGSLFGAVVAFLSTVLMARVFSPEDFGKASMFTLFVNLATILIIFGTDQAFVRFFYEEKIHLRGALLQNCLKVSFILFIPILGLFFFLRKYVMSFLFSDYNFYIFAAIIFATIVQILHRFASLTLRMEQKANAYSILEILNKLLILLGILFFSHFIGGNYLSLIYATIFGYSVILICLLFYQKDYWKFKKQQDVLHSKVTIWKFSYPLAFTLAVMWLFEGIDKFALRRWSSFEELGLYAAAFKIIGLIAVLKTAFTTFWTPVAYEQFQNNPREKLFFTNISKIVSVIMILVGVAIIMFRDIIIMLLGSEYKEASSLLSFLVFVPIMYTISETTVIGINFYKKVKWHMFIVCISCICNFFGNWIMVPSYGAMGASISTGVSYIVFFILRTFISKYYFKVDYGLVKLFISVGLLGAYSLFSIFPHDPKINYGVGTLVLCMICSIYLKDINLIKGKLVGKTLN